MGNVNAARPRVMPARKRPIRPSVPPAQITKANVAPERSQPTRTIANAPGFRNQARPDIQKSKVSQTRPYFPCSPSCKLPTCFCPYSGTPGDLPKHETPQFVYISFDDYINNYAAMMRYYERLFPATRRNPNGCPIAATFFLTHNGTQYDQVKKLYDRGHEIADHSITHINNLTYWYHTDYNRYTTEIQGQRQFTSTSAGIPLSKIRGYKSPFLAPGGDVQFQVLQDNGFLYDASLVPGKPTDLSDSTEPLWPFTMHQKLDKTLCVMQGCPNNTYPGLWEFPINLHFLMKGDQLLTRCSMIDTACWPGTYQDTLNYFWQNFNRHYNGNKAPFQMSMHATWLDWYNHRLDALDQFIQDILKLPDVFIVPMGQIIDWMKKLIPLSQMKRNGAFKCNVNK